MAIHMSILDGAIPNCRIPMPYKNYDLIKKRKFK